MAAPLPNVRILLVRCGSTQWPFGVRLEEIAPGQWACTWAFALSEQAAEREGYGSQQLETLRGEFGMLDAYPGCPHCGCDALQLCHCGGLACWDGQTRTTRCPWCHKRSAIGGTVGSLQAGGDR